MISSLETVFHYIPFKDYFIEHSLLHGASPPIHMKCFAHHQKFSSLEICYFRQLLVCDLHTMLSSQEATLYTMQTTLSRQRCLSSGVQFRIDYVGNTQ